MDIKYQNGLIAPIKDDRNDRNIPNVLNISNNKTIYRKQPTI